MARNGGNGPPLGSYLTVGMVLVACILLGWFLGSWMDKKLGTAPWGIVIGVLLGSAAGFLELFRTVTRNLK